MPVAAMAVSAGLGGGQVPWSLLWEPELAAARLSGRSVRLCSVIICTECLVGPSAVPGHGSTSLGLPAVPWCGGRDLLFCNAGKGCGTPFEKENDSSEVVGVLLFVA